MRRLTWVLLVGLISVVAPAAASADSHGAAPLKDPHGAASRKAHASFVLPAGTWRRVATTRGRYTQQVTAPDGTACVLTLAVSAHLQKSRPNIGAPLANGGLTGSGTTGALTWLVGRADGLSIAAGRERTPAKVSAGYRWIFAVVDLSAATTAGATNASCSALRSATSLKPTISKLTLSRGAAPA